MRRLFTIDAEDPKKDEKLKLRHHMQELLVWITDNVPDNGKRTTSIVMIEQASIYLNAAVEIGENR